MTILTNEESGLIKKLKKLKKSSNSPIDNFLSKIQKEEITTIKIGAIEKRKLLKLDK